MNIAILLTCFNRKDKTVACLTNVYKSLDVYNKDNSELKAHIYVVDDGCTDGTSDAISNKFGDKDVHIIKNSGKPLFWAGGMRLAWNTALKENIKWDYFLLLNDDTNIFENCISELMGLDEYCFNKYGKHGLYSGITCASDNRNKTTYGGDLWISKFRGRRKLLNPSGKPQSCDVTNANILLVSKYVVDTIGIFYSGFSHGLADFDYSMQAKKRGLPVYVTANYCGSCDNDHKFSSDDAEKIISMSLNERIKYFKHPKNSAVDYLKFTRRNLPVRFVFSCVFRALNIFFPKIYYKINK